MTHPEDFTPETDLVAGRDPEAPEADAAEQATLADPRFAAPAVSSDLEAPDWDAHEQSLVVDLEDEYR